MNLPEPQVAEMSRPPAAMKFTYASGSRPLEGFTVKRGVGRGGFGEVYFATSDAGKEVALKLIRRNMDVELRGATQCLNLKHPNLIGLYDIRTDEMGDQWIIMEYVAGESLEDAIDRHPGGMPMDQMQFWMRGLCAGVAYLHDHGIVHRDLKPGNIFVDEGTVKIGDYGLAKFISCSRRSGQTESVGTVHYMAPEIANGRYGREIDTYALGIILFEMLTGTVPFEGESVGEVLMKHLTAEPDLSRLDEPYRDIVRRALAKDPEVRLKSVGEMLALMPAGGGDAASAAEYFNPASIHPIAAGTASIRDPAPRHSEPALREPLEEPIWKAIRGGYRWLLDRLGGSDPQKREGARALAAAAATIAVIMLMFGGGFGGLVQLTILGVFCYAVYFVVWIALIRPTLERSARQAQNAAAHRPGNAQPVAAASAKGASLAAVVPGEPHSGDTPASRYAVKLRRKRLRANWRERANRRLAEQPLREKLSQLTASMLMAAAVVFLVSIAMPILGVGGWATYMWLATVVTLASWAILVPAKFVEGRTEDHTPMRLVMLLVGGLVGAAAFGIGEMLLVDLPRAWQPIDSGWGLISHEMLDWPQPPSPREAGGNPPFSVYVTFFAFLFVAVRWWRRAEFTRNAKLSLWTVAGCVFAAWLVHLFWWFPQPAGMMVAGMTALAVQLASPWMPPSQRRELAAEIERGE